MPNRAPPEPPVLRDLRALAPGFAQRVAEALNRCWHAGLDPVVYEATRALERQRWLYGIGRVYTPPGYDLGARVTNVADARYGWHFYGLAVDVISRAHAWDDESFFPKIAAHFTACGCDWGGDWTTRDLPHFQFHGLKATPSDRARELLTIGGSAAVWAEVGAR